MQYHRVRKLFPITLLNSGRFSQLASKRHMASPSRLAHQLTALSLSPHKDALRDRQADDLRPDLHEQSFEEILELATPLAARHPLNQLALNQSSLMLPQTSDAPSTTSSSSSWQTIRAGLLSPPSNVTLFSPSKDVLYTAADHGASSKAKSNDENEEPTQGLGGWLVDLVEWASQPADANKL